MRVYLYNKRGDLVLGLSKVKKIKVQEDGSLDITTKAKDGSQVGMFIQRTDYNSMVIGNK